METVVTTNIQGAKKLFSGKVRDIYEADAEHYVIVSTDRISAFDYVFPNGIPDKGKILNGISNLWFGNMGLVKNHIVETDYKKFPAPFNTADILKDRSVLVKKASKIDFECIVRGYIIGSGWNDYQKTGTICGLHLPSGLKMAEKLPQPIFTPSTKAEQGHDENISGDEMQKALGRDLYTQISETSIKVFNFASEYLDKAGIIIADTKLEFGIINGELILIDEVLTPDSSRFWDKSKYQVGTSPVSFDKQFIRDYLNTTTWDKNSPAPPLPDEIIMKTRDKYMEIYDRIKKLFS